MSALYWIAGAVLLVLLALAFRRKRVADQIERFSVHQDAIRFADSMSRRGFDCFISRNIMGLEQWEVRCYRRGRQS